MLRCRVAAVITGLLLLSAGVAACTGNGSFQATVVPLATETELIPTVTLTPISTETSTPTVEPTATKEVKEVEDKWNIDE